MYNELEQDLDRKQVYDSLKRVEEVDFEAVRFIVLFNDGKVLLANSRKELKEIVSLKEAEIDKVMTLSDRTDRYVDWETQKRYKVGVNCCKDDEWYCSYVDEQYTVYVMAKNKNEAIDKAKQYAEERWGDQNNYFEPVWIYTFNPKKGDWSYESLVR